MTILAYADRISVAPGESLRVHASADGGGSYRWDAVRLIHGDTSPDGPGYKDEVMPDAGGERPARRQATHSGSFVVVPDAPALSALESFSIRALVWPTTPAKGWQGIVTKWSSEAKAGFGLWLDEGGHPALRIGDGSGAVEVVRTGTPLLERCWFLVAATFDAASGRMTILQQPIVANANARLSVAHGLDARAASASGKTSLRPKAANGAPLLVAASFARTERGRVVPADLYNGKIERPRIDDRALGRTALSKPPARRPAKTIVAEWDFADGIGASGIPTSRVTDRSANGLHGACVNLPARAMTGAAWTGDEFRFRDAPEQWGAIHFHDDDLADCGWEPDFEITIPEGWKSGLYAVRLRAGDAEEHVPFVVRPPRGRATAKIALLLPTASYMAYANDHLSTDGPLVQLLIGHTPVLQKSDLLMAERRELGLSTYDVHSDYSGVCYSSRLRPILNMRPKYRAYVSPSLWQFAADLHLIDWLEAKGFAFDVVTDEDLHLEGVDLLKPYRAVLTGSHPEYDSAAMLDAIEAYQRGGGRFLYMGANGFYWVTAYHPENPAWIEVRKGGASQAWKAQPGEQYFSFTGELGGAWRNRARAPQKIAGTGFIAQGFDVSSHYRRMPDSRDPRAAWIFEGVAGETFGDFGLVGGGAAGLELDIADSTLGTPPHALIVASSEGHTDNYLEVLEELYFNMPATGGTESPRVRADMVFYETGSGGAVFSVSSIAWCGSLSWNGYDNDVSRITANVLRRFAADEPLPEPPK